jgi:hypothetical protein
MKQYASFAQVFYVYWAVYGGVRALVLSPYFHISLFVSAICYPLWWGSSEGANITLGAIPNILGFSIGAFAVILSFGQNSLALLKNPEETQSKYLGVVSSFVHFILVQSLALIIALIGRAWPLTVIGALGFVLLVYSIALAVAASMRLFRLARIYNQVKTEDAKSDQE